jgi:hypothetical protein
MNEVMEHAQKAYKKRKRAQSKNNPLSCPINELGQHPGLHFLHGFVFDLTHSFSGYTEF